MIAWEKRGRIFVPDGTIPWMRSHAAVPVADLLDEDRLRIYFGARDDQNRSRIGWVDVDPVAPTRVLDVSREPLLSLGELGTFDDNGMMPSCIVSRGHRKYLYYIGWNPQVTVPYRVAIGLAVSGDGGLTYYRHSAGPIFDRDRHEPFFNTTPCVLHRGDRWQMWYSSCTGWETIAGRPEPAYHVRYAESDDGVDWRRTGIVCIDYDSAAQAIARPWVVDLGDRYGMWFSYRGLCAYRSEPRASYRLGYAESTDGVHWDRQSGPAGLDRSTDEWDSLMVCYTNVLPIRGRLHCFYNGSGFGRSGFGYAEARNEGIGSVRAVA
jgi:predicted GH43/DUF377 family glycosyl hydrolase